MAIGRISGPLLKANLLREGVNLAFENDLLYLDVNNSRVGINTASPQYDLDVNGTTRSIGVEVSTLANIADVTITGNSISTTQPTLVLGTADNVIYQNRLTIDSFDLDGNTISTNVTNADIELAPNGTGSVEIFGDTNVYGNIVATGSITADGNITIGDADTDNVTFNAEIASNIIPDVNLTYNLGSPTRIWKDVYTETLYANTVTALSIEVDGVDLALRQGNIWYVSENGDDTYSGDHPNDTFGTLKYALTQATAGDTIHIYPGTYQEEFPMTVPVGVTIKGHSIRGVNITPTLSTQSNDAFLLNGETTIEDLTIKDFYTGYAFRFAPSFNVTTRSPYIRNISVITKGSVTSASDPNGFAQGDAGKGAYIDGAVALSTSNEASMLFHSVTFITPGVDCITMTNGVRVEWLNSFTYFANRGLYALDGVSGLKGTGKTSVRVDGLTGTIVNGNTFTYYDTDGLTVLATGTINGVDADGKFYVNGNLSGLETAQNRGGKTVALAGDAALSTTFKKYGSASLRLDGTGDYASVVSNNDFGFGTGDFTVEGYFRFDSVATTQNLFDFRAGASSDVAPVVYIAAGGQLRYYSYSADRITGSTLVADTWYHIAVSRSGNSTRMFVNGVLQGSAWTVSPVDYGVAKPVVIGARWDGINEFAGYIDEVRISKDIARYTAAFGALVAAFTSDADTKLLLHFDGTNLSTTIVDDTLETQDLRFSNGATAKFVTLANTTDFGAELRSIGSACVYGNYGAYGDGSGVLMYLVSQNFAYIGNGKNFDNDELTAIQANEVVELNNAKIRYSSVDHQGDFRVGDLFYVDQQTGTVNFTSATFNIETTSGITITTGGDTTTITGDRIDTGNLRFSGNTIESLSGDINLDSSSGIVKITSTGALQLPTGDTASRPSPQLGMIRYNTDTNLYEGYDGNWIALNGVYDLDLNTYITAELAPGANDDTIRFYTDGQLRVDINSTRLNTPRIEVDDIAIDGNVIETVTTNTDLILSANGTGAVVIDDLAFKDSTITNRTTDGVMYFQQQGDGYFKIAGSNGVVLPVGTSSQRPGAAFRETGMTRYNTEQGYLEIWDGTSWVSVAGATGSITYSAAEDLAIEYVLTLG